jgi:hypothetical protein
MVISSFLIAAHKSVQSLAMRRTVMRPGGLSMRCLANRPLHVCLSKAQDI